MSKLTEKLDYLKKSGVIKDWVLSDVDENGVVGKTGQYRNCERLSLLFPDDYSLILETFCSGCSENTCFTLPE